MTALEKGERVAALNRRDAARHRAQASVEVARRAYAVALLEAERARPIVGRLAVA